MANQYLDKNGLQSLISNIPVRFGKNVTKSSIEQVNSNCVTYGSNNLSLGEGCVAGSNGCRIKNIPDDAFNNYNENLEAVFVIQDDVGNYGRELLSGLERGETYTVSIFLKASVDNIGVIKNVNVIEPLAETWITLDKPLVLSTLQQNQWAALTEEDKAYHYGRSYLRINEHPEWGDLKDVINGSIAIGIDNKAYSRGAFSAGQECMAYGKYSFTSGDTTQAGYAGVAVNKLTKAIGLHSFACNYGTETHADNSFASGYYNKVYGQYGFAAGGKGNTINTTHGFVTGESNTVNGSYSAVFGRFNTSTTSDQTVIGRYNETDSSALFIVGSGSSSSRKNAFKVLADGRGVVGKAPTNTMDVANKGYVDSKFPTTYNTTPFTTAGWYRIAVSSSTVADCCSIFKIRAKAVDGYHWTDLIVAVSHSFAGPGALSILHHDYNGEGAITQIRLNYSTSTNPYEDAYVEVYTKADKNGTYVSVDMLNDVSMLSGKNLGWLLNIDNTPVTNTTGRSLLTRDISKITSINNYIIKTSSSAPSSSTPDYVITFVK